jgi:hypothetical protein
VSGVSISGVQARRLAVTLGVPAALLVARRYVPLPIELQGAAVEVAKKAPTLFSAFALSLASWTSAALLVELVAAIVPRWRRLRVTGAPGRQRLWRAMLPVGAVLAVLQSFFMARWLLSTDWMAPTLGNLAVVVATLTAGSALSFGGAAAISRFGLGNGFSVLLAAALVEEQVPQLLVHDRDGPELARAAVVGALLAAALAWALRRGGATRAVGAEIPCPASGTLPAAVALNLPVLVQNVAQFIGSDPQTLAGAVIGPSAGPVAARAGIALALALALTWVFGGPLRLAAVWRRFPPEDAPAPRRAVAGAAARAVLFNVLLVVAAAGLAAARAPVDLLSATVLIAVALDLIGEWRAQAHGPLISIWPSSRPYELGTLLARLRGAGIPAHARALHHRSLLQALGPYLPVEILVPKEHEQPARVLLDAPPPV